MQITDVHKQSVVHFGVYDWLVLDVQPGKALLMTKHCVEQRQYHSIYTDITWANCTLRQYLGSEFLGKFEASDQCRILTTRNVNSDNPWWNTHGGVATDDKIFLLSLDEVVAYFGGNTAKVQLKNRPGIHTKRISDPINVLLFCSKQYRLKK